MANQNEPEQIHSISKQKLYLIMFFMFVTGSANTVVLKLQDKVVVGQDPDTKKNLKYSHPYLQCANMCAGEFMCLIIYFIRKRFFTKKVNSDEQPVTETKEIEGEGRDS
jgi:hypothetical protein